MIESGNDRHEHLGKTSRGMFDDESIMMDIGVKEGDHFLDGGCADGHFSIAASRIAGEKGIVYAMDIHTPSLDLLRDEIRDREIMNIKVIEEDLRIPIPVKDLSLDHFFMSNVFHGFVHNGEDEPVFKNIIRTLKENGTLTLLEWDSENVIRGPPKDHRLSVETAERIMEENGFKLSRTFHPTEQHVMMIFKRKQKL